MSLHRYAAKRDGNEAAIIEALEKTRWTVLRLSGEDTPDLLAARWEKGYPRVVLCECKSRRGKVRPGQARVLDTWPGETAVLRSVEDALAL
jgi:hypothetical protein